jgi:RNA polymerase sigma factor (sigma-70 family)
VRDFLNEFDADDFISVYATAIPKVGTCDDGNWLRDIVEHEWFLGAVNHTVLVRRRLAPPRTPAEELSHTLVNDFALRIISDPWLGLNPAKIGELPSRIQERLDYRARHLFPKEFGVKQHRSRLFGRIYEVDSSDIAATFDHASDQPGPAEQVMQAEHAELIASFLFTLTAQERLIIFLRYWKKNKWNEIADDLGLPLHRVLQIHRKTITESRIALISLVT